MTSPTSPGSSSPYARDPTGRRRCTARPAQVDEPDPGGRGRRADVELGVAEAVHPEHLGPERAVRSGVRLRAPAFRPGCPGRWAAPGGRRSAPSGQFGGGRGEDVPAGEGRPRPAGGWAGSSTAAGQRTEGGWRREGGVRCRGRRGRRRRRRPRWRRARRAVPTPGSTTARITPGASQGAARHRVSAPARTSWAGIWWVMSMTGTPGARRAMTRWTMPTNSSSSP